MKPLIVVNFKAYKEGLSNEGIKLIELLSDYSNVIMSVPAPLIGLAAGLDVKNNTCVRRAKIYAQHIDPISEGAHTGSITAKEIRIAGASGSLINHSEKRVPMSEIKQSIEMLKQEKLESIVCCQNKDEALKIKELKPDYIAYEPPELIGGDVSVTTRPEAIKSIVEAVKPLHLLVGAGVKTRSDILTSIKLGAKGVLIASGIIKAKDKEAKVKELVEYEGIED